MTALVSRVRERGLRVSGEVLRGEPSQGIIDEARDIQRARDNQRARTHESGAAPKDDAAAK